MAGVGQGLLGGKHFGFVTEVGFEFAVVDFDITCTDNQDSSIITALKGKGLSDAGRNSAHGLGS